MKKLLLLIVFVAISSFVFASFHVSFARIQTNDGSIKYSLTEDFSKEIDASKYQNIDGNTKIYVSFSSSAKELTGINCARYDKRGNRIKSEKLVLTSLGGGRYSFELPSNTEFDEISIEPILSNMMVNIDLSVLCDGVEVHDGQWFITSKGKDPLSNGTIELDSSSKYSVSFKFDSAKYYFASSDPQRVLAVGETKDNDDKSIVTVVFEQKDASEDMKYVINLKQYASLIIDKNTLKKIQSIKRVSTGEELEIQNISNYKIKNGESLVVTLDINSVIEALGIIIDNSIYSGSIRQTTITIPEDNISPVLYIHSTERAGKSVGITWDVDKEVTVIPDVTISCGKDVREYKSGKQNDSVYILDGDVLFIDVKKPSEKISLSISVNGIKTEDISEAYSRSYSYDKVESVSISVKNGYRFREALIENGEHLKVNYLLGSTALKDGQFIPNGEQVTIIVECPYEYEAINKHFGNNSSDTDRTLIKGTFMVSSETGIEDFRVSEKAAAGYFLDPDMYNDDNGSLEFFRDNNAPIVNKTFVKYSESIRFVAKPHSGYIVNYVNSDGQIVNRTAGNLPNNEISVSWFFDSIKFVSDEIRTVLLPQPDIGGTVQYKDKNGRIINESFIEGKKGDVIRAEFVASNHFKPKNPIQTYTIEDSNGPQSFPIGVPFEEIEMPEMRIELVGNWNDSVEISFNNSPDLDKISQIYPQPQPQSHESGYDVSSDDYIIIVSSTKGFSRVYDYNLYISGYSLNDGEFLCASVIYPITDDNAFGNLYYSNNSSTKIEIKSILSQQQISNVEKVIIRLQKANGFVFSSVTKNRCAIKVLRTDENHSILKDGDFVLSEEKLILQVSPSTGYYLESDKDSDGYVTQEILGKDLSSTVEKLEVKQFLRIGLTKEDSYGTYSYYLNGKEVSAEILDCRESDSIKVIFKVKDGLKIKRGINFFASSSTGTKTFNKGGLINLNNRSITFEDLGITVEKKE